MLKLAVLALGGVILAAGDLQLFQANPEVTPAVEITLLDSSLGLPTALSFAPDGRLFITEKGGAIKIYKEGAMNAAPYATVSPVYTGNTESGLLGLCLDPNFATNGYLYVFVTRTSSVQQIVRYTSTGDSGSDPTVMVDNIPTLGQNHNGGGIGFGPDGYLYAVVGESGNAPADAQVAASWRGKVLRFDASTVPASIPDSNPTAGSAVYSLGHRHPFRLTFRPGTGALYVSENGPSQDDEINVITPGANYGWPVDTGPNASGAYTDPVFTFPETIAITDLLFYTGSTLPHTGNLFYVDYNHGRIRRLEVDASSEQITGGPYDFISGIASPVDVEQGPDGALYYISHWWGQLYKAQAAAPLTVTQVSPAPDSQVTSAPAAMTLGFSAAVDAATATGLNIKLDRAGPDAVFDTPDDVTVTPASMTAEGDTVTLELSGVILPVDTYRIRVSGTDVPPSPHSDLFAHWKLDEGAGTSTADSSGQARHGTLNGVEWSQGLFGKALRFNSDAGRVDIDAGVLTPDWTVSLWVYRLKDTYWWATQSLMDAKDSEMNTSLRLSQAAGDDVGMTEYGVVDYGSGYEAPIGSWVHLAFTSDASNARVYVNGVLESTAPRAFDLTVDTLGSAIAERTRSVSGLLDEVQVYSRVLTEAEIASLAVPSGGLRGTFRQLLDGDFSGALPSGDGVEGGDFVSQFTIAAPAPPEVAEAPVEEDDDDGCGLLGIEVPFLWAVILLFRRRRKN